MNEVRDVELGSDLQIRFVLRFGAVRSTFFGNGFRSIVKTVSCSTYLGTPTILQISQSNLRIELMSQSTH